MPRCSSPGYLEEHWVRSRGGREYGYWRVVHYLKEGGDVRKVIHYLGPIDREYIRVERVHELGLTNILHQDPATIVYNVVSRLIDQAGLRNPGQDPGERSKLLAKVRRLKELMRELVLELESVERELSGGEG
jgi:hypothetical protein